MAKLKIAVANLKGGCGKSTLALNLASGLEKRGKTILLDVDPQGTLEHWLKETFEGMPDVKNASKNVKKIISDSEKNYDFVVADCPPSLESGHTQEVLKEVDLLLIPVLPSPPDLWSSVHMVDAVKEAQKKNTKLKAKLVRNQVETRSALSKAMRQAIEFCGLPALESSLARRASYRWAALEGISVYQFGSRGETAVNDIEAIIKEIL
ncbi:ParA family protein [Gammaproteobacteria bacterium]|jgi:chromosome partitioning protein|nr:ParA family protein [Gammaproteobacteria bacterium]NBQ34667.1 cobyrinic acid a,c-diamide synthase [Gammaproteobacteria bacterium]